MKFTVAVSHCDPASEAQTESKISQWNPGSINFILLFTHVLFLIKEPIGRPNVSKLMVANKSLGVRQVAEVRRQARE